MSAPHKRGNDLRRGARMRSEEDTLGSYTGVSFEDQTEKPVQDADDL